MGEKEKIYKMLESIKPEHDFASSHDYLADGYLDSMDIVMLNGMIEENFKIKIDAMDILPENYTNVESLLALVEKSRKGDER